MCGVSLQRRGRTGAEGIVGHNERAQTDLCDMNTWNSSEMSIRLRHVQSWWWWELLMLAG